MSSPRKLRWTYERSFGNTSGKNTSCGGRVRFRFCLSYFLALCPETNDLMSPTLNFLISKVGLIPTVAQIYWVFVRRWELGYAYRLSHFFIITSYVVGLVVSVGQDWAFERGNKLATIWQPVNVGAALQTNVWLESLCSYLSLATYCPLYIICANNILKYLYSLNEIMYKVSSIEPSTFS